MTAPSTIQPRSERTADKNAIRPFTANVPEAELTELRQRIIATRYAERETRYGPGRGTKSDSLEQHRTPGCNGQSHRHCQHR